MWKKIKQFIIWAWAWLFGKTLCPKPTIPPTDTTDYITTENGIRINTEYNKNIIK